MKEFYVDPKQPGFVRGGFYDAMGGMLVGVKARAVCDVLNAAVAWDVAFNGSRLPNERAKNIAEDELAAAVRALHS
jgi:hypothetical protein